MATEVVAPVAPVQVGSENTLEKVSKASLMRIVRPLIKETAFEFGGKKRARAELTRALVANGMPELRKLKKERESLLDVAPDIATLRREMRKLNAAYDATRTAMNDAAAPQKAAFTEFNAVVKHFKNERIEAMKTEGVYYEEYVIPDELQTVIAPEQVEEAKAETESAVKSDTENALIEAGGA